MCSRVAFVGNAAYDLAATAPAIRAVAVERDGLPDGLDRDAIDVLEAEMERLHKSCRRLIWLNPLLRFDAYQPISQGPRVMIRNAALRYR